MSRLCGFYLLCLAAPSAIWAQPSGGGIAFTGSVRARVYFWDWFTPASGTNNYQYSGNLFRLGLSQSRDAWDWSAEFAVPVLLGLPANATGSGAQQGALGLGANYLSANSGSQNTAMIFPKQLFCPLPRLGRQRSPHSANRTLRVPRRQRGASQERHPGRRETRPRHPAPDRQFRILRRRPQL